MNGQDRHNEAAYRISNKPVRCVPAPYQLILIFAVITLLTGCPQPKKIPPALTRRQMVNYYNANIAAVVPFKAGIFSWKAGWVDENGKQKSHGDLGGSIIYAAADTPGGNASLRLETTLGVFGKAMLIGSNEREYWVIIKPQKKGWWGKYENQGKPCARKVPMNPQTFLEFAGLKEIPELPLPAYKVSTKDSTLYYVEYEQDGYRIVREIIIDRRNNLPVAINTYDNDGKLILHSTLGDYRKLAEAWLPGKIEIATADEAYFIRLQLKGYRPFRMDERRKALLFRRPENVADIDEYIQVDAECDIEADKNTRNK